MKKAFALFATAPIVAATVIAFHPGNAVASSSPLRLDSAPTAYVLDPNHASIGFDIQHIGLSQVHGRFNKFTGTVNLDSADMTNSSVEFTVDVASVDTAVAARDNHLRTADFFEVEKFPSMKFVSTGVRKDGEHYVVDGNLTIKETTKSISIPFKVMGPVDGMQGGKVMGVIAEPFVIKRLDFGVGNDQKLPNGAMALGNEVTVRISFEAKSS
ncbi:MAG: YceI family protein [Fimbriimonadaceae bacterium]|nr:YceI family protein [Fimbriimonadaceae bacterium]